MLHSPNSPEEEYTIAFSRKDKKAASTARNVEALIHPNRQTYHILAIEIDQKKQLISLEDATYTIGRHQANAIVLDDQTVSRNHAFLLRICDVNTKQHSFRIIDGDLNGKRSQNGLWVNGKRCFIHDLQDHDVISFGEHIHATYVSTSNLNDPRIGIGKTTFNPYRFLYRNRILPLVPPFFIRRPWVTPKGFKTVSSNNSLVTLLLCGCLPFQN